MLDGTVLLPVCALQNVKMCCCCALIAAVCVAAEEDGLLLAFSAAVEKLLPSMPAPPSTPACQGCTPKVEFQAANYSGVGKPGPNDVTSLFSLHFEGQCMLTQDLGPVSHQFSEHAEL